MSLEMISYNVQYARKPDRLTKFIRKMNPDIFCLQEFPENGLGMFAPEYNEIFEASFSKNGHQYGELIAYKKNVQLLQAFGVDLGLMSIPGLLSLAKGRRTALIAQFQTDIGNIVLGNVHLEWFARPRYKLSQLDRVISAIGAADDDPRTPTILTGDFNYSTLFSGNALERYLQRKGFKIAPPQNTHKLFGLNHQVDYTAFRNCGVTNMRTERTGLSDHNPQLFTVTGSGG